MSVIKGITTSQSLVYPTLKTQIVTMTSKLQYGAFRDVFGTM